MTEHCPTCGAATVVYVHSLSKAHVDALGKLYMRAGLEPYPLHNLFLPFSERTNFHKLRYWGLAEQIFTENQRKRSGIWAVTPLGERFLRGERRVRKTVTTYRAKVQSTEGPLVRVDQIQPEPLWQAEEYAAARRPA